MSSTFVWGTVTAVGPLRVQLDGTDTAALPITPDSLVGSLAVADRVRCEMSDSLVIVVGRAGGLALASTTLAGLVPLSTDAQAVTGTDTTHAVTPHALAAAVAILNSYTWQPVVPSSVVSVGGTSATFDTTTGLITVNASCTSLKGLGVFADGYEHLIRTREKDSFTAYTDNMKFWLLNGSTAYAAASYNLAGNYEQYNGTRGSFDTNSNTYLPVGWGATAGADSRREITVMTPHESTLPAIFKVWQYSPGSAARVEATGSYNDATATADGFQLVPATGTFQGTVHVFRRKALA